MWDPPTSRRVRAYPGPSRFMLVLFASLKAGLSPDLARARCCCTPATTTDTGSAED